LDLNVSPVSFPHAVAGGDELPMVGHGLRYDYRDVYAGFYRPQPQHPVMGTFPRPPPA
jgi:hypothetical protein